MAKKTRKAPAKKKSARSASGAKRKKKTSAGGASKPRGGGAAKSASAGATKKKSTSASKKAAGTKKKTTTRKKTTAKSSGTTRKKPASSGKSAGRTKKTAAASKKAGSKKNEAKGKAAAAKTSKTKPEAAAKSAAKSGKKSTGKKGASGSAAEKSRQGSAPAVTSLSDAQAAARKLAAAAGLRPVETSDNDVLAPVDNSKRLTKSPLSKRELNKFRKMLEEKRAEVAGDVENMENEALGRGEGGSLSHMPQHLADHGSDEYDQSLALGIAASQRDLLREIDNALQRIEEGAYGICEVLGTPINQDRLEATPWTRVSVEGARLLDRRRYMP